MVAAECKPIELKRWSVPVSAEELAREVLRHRIDRLEPSDLEWRVSEYALFKMSESVDGFSAEHPRFMGSPVTVDPTLKPRDIVLYAVGVERWSDYPIRFTCSPGRPPVWRKIASWKQAQIVPAKPSKSRGSDGLQTVG